ncbi:MAG: patatin family protein [Erysipelothrix sp.]|jgi:predicted patatin/cPLA2 family phospholipase|nr:patatin family protein [Erysipelothrix sp.]
MSKYGLVLEGGGLRSAYTAGILNWFIDHDVHFDFVAGVSSGALLAVPFVTRNRQAIKDLATIHAASKENVGLHPLLKEGNFVGYNYLIDKVVPNQLKLSVDEVRNAPTPFEMGVYDIYASKTFWMRNTEMDDHWKFLQAALTLPIAGRAVKIKGRKYMDAGVNCMIPTKRSIANGCDKHVIITTKPKDFVRKDNHPALQLLLDLIYFKYPILKREFRERTGVFNDEIALAERLEKENNAIFLRPTKNLGIKRFSGDLDQLVHLYELGYQQMETEKERMLDFMKK